jgi:signal transduction histidine kinase
VVGELGQVWLNLIDNAIDAAPEGGHVTVTAGRERDSVVVRVIDDGAGIAAADRDRIFEPFFTTKPVGQGSGLGLDLARALVHSNRGSIEVASRPGRTEFRVCLPAAV